LSPEELREGKNEAGEEGKKRKFLTTTWGPQEKKSVGRGARKVFGQVGIIYGVANLAMPGGGCNRRGGLKSV